MCKSTNDQQQLVLSYTSECRNVTLHMQIITVITLVKNQGMTLLLGMEYLYVVLLFLFFFLNFP